MKNNVDKINELMTKIHELHNKYSLEEESYNTIYEEFEDDNSQSSKIISEISSLLVEDENQTTEYFNQCSLLDFYILICEHKINFSVNLCKQLLEIWNNRANKEEKKIYDDIVESLVFEQMY